MLPGQQFLQDILISKNILLRTTWSFIPGWKKINNYIYISIYGLTTLNKPKSRQVYINDGIITQNIFNAAVSTSGKLKTNTKKLHYCEYLISTWCLLHPGYQIWLFRDNLTGIQWVKRMYVWSVKVGMNLSVIWTIVTFLHTRGPGSKSVWVATSYRSCFWKCTVQASLWYAALDRGEGKKK